MDPSADRLIELFHQAKNRASSEDLDRFLAEACQDEPELRQQVLSLLKAHHQIGDFLQAPLVPPPRAPSAEGLGDKIGSYRLLEQIGEGGCGVVYLAEQAEPVRRRVALKVIKLGMDTKAVVARFEAERQALALMDHPHIAKVLEAGATAAGRPYFVMELVRGRKITDYCDSAHLPVEQRLRLFIQVCQAVQHAHQKGVIHRDLKPSNILVSVHDGHAVPKVIDFGIAKATTDQPLTDKTVFTAVEQFIGTPAYMSPEQAEMSGLDIDTRSDIYSLGVLLYELLTGATPFDTQELLESGFDTMRKIIREHEPVRPSTRLTQIQSAARSQIAPHTSHIADDLDWIVMKCLEKERARRYATANAVAADLERYLQGEPVVARPPSTSYRIQKSILRHRVAFASAAAVLLTLVGGLVVSLWQTVRLSEAQLIAKRQAYVSKMREARQAWEDNNLSRLRELLKATESEEDRGFEWYYWQRQAHLELKTLRGHQGPVVDVGFSPDGERVLTASLDGSARVWDWRRGATLRTFEGHAGTVTSACWSSDGGRVITASADGTAIVWDAANGRRLFALKGHTAGLTSVRISNDGRQIVTGSHDGTARLWRADTGDLVLELDHGCAVLSVGISADGRLALSAGANETSKIWDATTGTNILRIQPPTAQIAVRPREVFKSFYAGFSPNGEQVVTVAQNQTARLWDASNGTELCELRGSQHWLSPRQYDVPLTAGFSPNGRHLIMGGLNFTASLWELETRTNLFSLKGHEAEVVAAAFSPDGRLIVTGSFDHTAKIWSAEASSESRSLAGHSRIVSNSTFSPDGGQIVTASWDGTAIIWDASTGRLRRTLDHSNAVWGVAFSPNSARLLSGDYDGTLQIWDAFNGEQLLRIRAHAGAIHMASFSRDGRRILTAAADSTAKLWDAATGRELLTLDHNERFVMAVFSPDSRRIATVCNDNDRNTLEDATAAVWDAETGRKLFDLQDRRNGFSCVAYSPNGQFLVTGSIDWTAMVWDASNGSRLFPLKGHSGQVIHLAISPDSRRIFTGGFDNTTRVWDATTGEELLTLKGAIILHGAISSDGRRIITGVHPPAVVWEVASPEEAAGWSEEEGRHDR